MVKRPVRWLLLTVLLGLAAASGRADDLVWATGRVFAADGKTPLAGAMVAVYDKKNRVVDYARTDENGVYALAVPRSALNLNRKGGGFLYQINRLVGGVGNVMTLPLKAGIKAVAATSSASDPLTRVGIGTASNLAQSLVDTISPDRKSVKTAREQPGALVMKVSAPGKNDALNIARVYWMQEEFYRVGGKEERALIAWFDPAIMTPAGGKEPSSISSEYLTFTGIRLEPSIAERGQTVKLTVAFPSPEEPRTPVVVVARNSRNGQTFQLNPIGGRLYQGQFEVDQRSPLHDQTICVLAYAEQDARPGRNRQAEDAINGAGLWNPAKPYVYNPLLVVSRNRAEVVLTVVEKPGRRR